MKISISYLLMKYQRWEFFKFWVFFFSSYCSLIALLLMCSAIMWWSCNVIKRSNSLREEVMFLRTQKTDSQNEIKIDLYFESIESISFNNSSIECFVFLLIFFCSVTDMILSSSATLNSQSHEDILNKTVEKLQDYLSMR